MKREAKPRAAYPEAFHGEKKGARRLHRRAGSLALGLMAVCVVSSTSVAQELDETDAYVNNVTFLLGYRSLGAADWAPVDNQIPIGLEFDRYAPGDIVGWEAGLSYSSDSAQVGPFDVSASFFELYGGARKTWSFSEGRLHPYVSAGLSTIFASAGISGASGSDSSFGIYLRGGAYYDITDQLFAGLDVRTLLFTGIGTGSADFVQLALTLGYSL